MKKLLIVILTLLIFTTLSTSVMAQGSDEFTNIYYDVTPSFTITIPENVILGETVAITASDVLIAEGTDIQVRIVGTNDLVENTFIVTRGSESLTYSVTNEAGDQTYLIDSIIANFTTNGSKNIKFSTPTQTPVYAGLYYGSISFDIYYNDNIKD